MIQIGYELEFSSPLVRADIIGDVQGMFKDVYWIQDHKRKHGSKRVKGLAKELWTLTFDNSLEPSYSNHKCYELITPVFPEKTSKQVLLKLFDWIEKSDSATNFSTALHVSISGPPLEKLNRLALIYEVDEMKWLTLFNRKRKLYCSPHSGYLIRRIQSLKDPSKLLEVLNRPLKVTKKKLYKLKDLERLRSINFNHVPEYVEFRMIGNKDYHRRKSDVLGAIDHFVNALKNSLDNVG